ncbi:MAG: chemotaxis protein [Cyanobacteria bacterium J06638_7]
MTSASVSFRITRSTEDLAQTAHALSQRLVMLEQRLEAVEVLLQRALEPGEERDPQELSSLDNVEQLLLDCRLLLGLDQQSPAAADCADAPVAVAPFSAPASAAEDSGEIDAEAHQQGLAA